MLSIGSQGLNLFQGLQGLFSGNRDPLNELQRYLDAMQSRFGPEATANHAMGIYHFLKGSPMGLAGINNIISGGQQGENLLRRGIASTGAPGAGVNLLRSSFLPSVAGSQVNNFNSGLFGQGMDITQSALARVAAGAGYPGAREPAGAGFARFAGGLGNTNWAPVMDWLRQKYGGGGMGAPYRGTRPSGTTNTNDWRFGGNF